MRRVMVIAVVMLMMGGVADDDDDDDDDDDCSYVWCWLLKGCWIPIPQVQPWNASMLGYSGSVLGHVVTSFQNNTCSCYAT